MSGQDYSHWNEEAEIVRQQENDQDSPYYHMSDEEIKEDVYRRMEDDDWEGGY